MSVRPYEVAVRWVDRVKPHAQGSVRRSRCGTATSAIYDVGGWPPKVSEIGNRWPLALVLFLLVRENAAGG